MLSAGRRTERERGSAHSSWMGTLYDNHHHFPSEDNTQGSLPELDCTATRAYGANFVWRVWWKWSHAPLKLFSRQPEVPPPPPVVSSPWSFIYLLRLYFLCVQLVPLIAGMASSGTCCVSSVLLISVQIIHLPQKVTQQIHLCIQTKSGGFCVLSCLIIDQLHQSSQSSDDNSIEIMYLHPEV